jgi:hypothetical protein
MNERQNSYDCFFVDIVGGVNRAAFGFSVDLSSFAQHDAVGMPRASEVKVFSSQ